MKVLFIYPNIEGFHEDSYHFGLASIIAVAKKNGHECKVVIVRKVNGFKNVLLKIEKFSPKVIGFSSVSSQYHHVLNLSLLIKSKYPNVLIVCGGVHPTINPQSLLKTKFINGFFLGESELSFVEFLCKIKNNEPFQDVDNFAYIKNGELIKNKLKPLIKDLDILPSPDKEIYPYGKIIQKLGYAHFFFNRGCPFLCSYCSNEALAKEYGMKRNLMRYRSPGLCIQEIEEVIMKYDVDEVSIMDDIFGMNKKWLNEFLLMYKERIKIKFACLLRIELISDNFLRKLKKAACHRIFFGVESGSSFIREKMMNRKMTNDQIIKAFDLCRKYRIKTLAVNIIGVPEETEEMIIETIELNKRIKPSTSGVNIFYPYKGTELGDFCFKKGLVDEKLYRSFSNERRMSVLNFSEEYKAKLNYYYENWEVMVSPYNLRIRMRRLLNRLGILLLCRELKKKLLILLKNIVKVVCFKNVKLKSEKSVS